VIQIEKFTYNVAATTGEFLDHHTKHRLMPALLGPALKGIEVRPRSAARPKRPAARCT